MPVLTQGTAAKSAKPAFLVENRLAAGSWRFRLTVVDETGQESAPAELVVKVSSATRPGGPVIATPPPTRPTPTTPIIPGPIRRPG